MGDAAGAGARPAGPAAPDRAAGLRRARRMRVLERRGASARLESLLPLTAGTLRIGMASLPLGFYFRLMEMAVVAALLTAACFGFTLAANLGTDNTTQQYGLWAPGRAAGERVAECPRVHEVSNAILRSSLGGFCDDRGGAASPLLCPARCRVRETLYAELDTFAAGGGGAANACPTLGQPCLRAATSNNATCCVLELEARDDLRLPPVHLWMTVVFVVVHQLWCLFIKKNEIETAEKLNASVISLPDYSILVQGIPGRRNPTTSEELYDFFCHYGEVVFATPVLNLGKPVSITNQILQVEMRIKEMRAQLGGAGSAELMASLGLRRMFDAAILGPRIALAFNRRKALEAAVLRETNKVERLKTSLRYFNNLFTDAYHPDSPMRNTMQTLIVFNYESHANNVYLDHEARSAFDVWKKVLCGRVVDAPMFKGRHISVSRAPEESDFCEFFSKNMTAVRRAGRGTDNQQQGWENTGILRQERFVCQVLSTLVTMAVLGAAALIQLYFDSLKDTEQNRVLEMEFANPTGGAALELKLLKLRVQVLSALSSAFVVGINVAFNFIARKLCQFEKWETRSLMERVLTFKLSVAALINSAVIPMIAATKKNFYIPGGFVEQAFYIQLFNAFVPDMLILFDANRILRRQVISHYAASQEMLDDMLVPSEFRLALRYSAAIRTLGLGIVFAPILPVSPVIAAAGLMISYCCDRVMALRIARKPEELNSKATATFHTLLLLLPLLQILACRFVFFAKHPQANAAFLVSISVWGAMLLAPFEKLLGITRDSALEDAGTDGLSFHDAVREGRVKFAANQGRRATIFGGRGDAGEAAPVPEMAGLSKVFTYCPSISLQADFGLQAALHQIFRAPEAPHPAISALMQGQKPNTGGMCTRKPPRRRLDTIVANSWTRPSVLVAMSPAQAMDSGAVHNHVTVVNPVAAAPPPASGGPPVI